MPTIFVDNQGVIVMDYLEECRRINCAYYAELRRLHQEIVKKKKGKLARGVLLLQDNQPAQASSCHYENMPIQIY